MSVNVLASEQTKATAATTDKKKATADSADKLSNYSIIVPRTHKPLYVTMHQT
jgi:hypothetical protein